VLSLQLIAGSNSLMMKLEGTGKRVTQEATQALADA
jgi:hypothetical protein